MAIKYFTIAAVLIVTVASLCNVSECSPVSMPVKEPIHHNQVESATFVKAKPVRTGRYYGYGVGYPMGGFGGATASASASASASSTGMGYGYPYGYGIMGRR